MTLTDLEWLREIFTDTKRRVASATAELLVKWSDCRFDIWYFFNCVTFSGHVILTHCFKRLCFCRAMRRTSAAFAVVRWLAGCHVRVLCRNGKKYGHSCYEMRIGNRIQACEWYHFQWPLSDREWLSIIFNARSIARPLCGSWASCYSNINVSNVLRHCVSSLITCCCTF